MRMRAEITTKVGVAHNFARSVHVVLNTLSTPLPSFLDLPLYSIHYVERKQVVQLLGTVVYTSHVMIHCNSH